MASHQRQSPGDPTTLGNMRELGVQNLVEIPASLLAVADDVLE
jgi:hypothetical protein